MNPNHYISLIKQKQINIQTNMNISNNTDVDFGVGFWCIYGGTISCMVENLLTCCSAGQLPPGNFT